MMRTTVAFATVALVLSGLVACGSSGSGSTGGAGGTSATTAGSGGSGGHGGDATPAESCAKPGDKGNEKGVGEYCTPSGHECTGFSFATVCLADFGQKQWFCTKLSCTMDSDCGTDAYCEKADMGSACVPNKCKSGSGGAGGSGGAAPDAGP